jgi:hypothetical protein
MIFDPNRLKFQNMPFSKKIIHISCNADDAELLFPSFSCPPISHQKPEVLSGAGEQCSEALKIPSGQLHLTPLQQKHLPGRSRLLKKFG